MLNRNEEIVKPQLVGSKTFQKILVDYIKKTKVEEIHGSAYFLLLTVVLEQKFVVTADEKLVKNLFESLTFIKE